VTPLRSSPAFGIVFSVVFAIVYVIAVEKNFALITYHPALGEFSWGAQQPKDGPAMYWYGWLATSSIAAFVAGFVAAWLPQGLVKRLWSGLAWVVPAVVMVAFCYLLRNYFLR
jgi:hypothetical protein